MSLTEYNLTVVLDESMMTDTAKALIPQLLQAAAVQMFVKMKLLAGDSSFEIEASKQTTGKYGKEDVQPIPLDLTT